MDDSAFEERHAAVFPRSAAGAPTPRVFALLDGARDERVYRAVYDSRLEYECLFTGELSYELAAAAPYLVRLDQTAALSRWLLEEEWTHSLGIFAWSFEDTETLRRHFRRLLQVRSQDGERLYFRYYDPRVMRSYLPTCRAFELGELFGPVVRYVVPSADGKAVGYERGARTLEIR
ncbi:MAG: DUF4123 domain-containing protein [Polyangiaceae bacterium]